MGEVGDGSANSTYYFDDIAFSTGPISGCTDPEANNYNPSATIDDGSCTYGSITLNITATVCETASEVRLTGPFWGWDPVEGPTAVSNGNGTWTFTFDPAPDQNMEYLLIVDGVQEDLIAVNTAADDWSCTPITDYWSYANRLWTLGSGDVTDIYYGSCTACENPFSVNDAELNTATIYPNPANDLIHVSNTNAQSITIFNISGQQVISVKNAKEEINLSKLSSGIYTLRITDSQGNFAYKKLIKK